MKNIRKKLKKAERFFEVAPKMKFYYGRAYKNAKVDDKQILFESFHGKTVSDSPLYMLLEFCKRPDAGKFTVYYATNGTPEHKKVIKDLKLPVKVHLVDVISREYAIVLATSKYLVNNSSFPAYFIKRPEQRYIQTWHGTPLKTLGKRMRLGTESMYNVQHNFLHASVVTFPNEYTREVIMRDYNLEDLYTGKVAMLGYPRNQVFLNEGGLTKKDLGLEGITCYAYMPTWRGTSNHDVANQRYTAVISRIFHSIDKRLSDDQKLFVNFHPLVGTQVSFDEYEHIEPFPEGVDNYSFLNLADALVTDYSSVFFDYSLTRKPIILFMYDLEEYIHDRGLYIDMTTLPFKVIYEAEGLGDYLAKGDFDDCSYVGSDYEREFLAYDHADNAAKALDLLFEDRAEGVPLDDYAPNTEKEWGILEHRPQKSVSDVALVCEGIDPSSQIAIFLKSKFTQDMSAYLYDEHRDDFNYIFITDTTPRSFAEDIMKRFSDKVAKRLEEREALRRLPNLKTSLSAVRLYKTVGGDSVAPEAIVGTEDEVFVEEGRLHIRLKSGERKLVLRSLALFIGNETVWTRALTGEEVASGEVVEDFASLKLPGKKLEPVLRLQLALIGVDAKTEKPVNRFVASPGNKFYTDDRSSLIFEPVAVDAASTLDSDCVPDGCISLDIVPNYNKGNSNLALLVANEGESLQVFKYAVLDHVRARKGRPVSLKMKLRKGDYRIAGVSLEYRSVLEDIVYEFECKTRESGDWVKITATLDPSAVALKDIYWDVYVLVEQFGKIQKVRVKLSVSEMLRLCVGNVQHEDSGELFFPYATKGGNLAFIYREKTPADSRLVRMRELAAFFVFTVLHPYWKRKRVWLVYEKFCALAQDNAYFFFKYCMDSLSDEEKKHIYYVIDRDSDDRKNLVGYEKNVIDRFSFKHFLYSMVAKIYVASDSLSHAYIWRPKPSLVNRRIRKHKIFFLQHGVTALKKVDNIFGKNGSSPMTYFLTTSENEQDIVVENFGYDRANAPVLGFSRWDALQDKSSKESPLILCMPTWRPWLEEQDDDVFCASEYFERYSSLIKSPRLLDLLEKNNVELAFYIHPKLAERIGAFDTVSPRVHLIKQGSEPLNELMMRSSMLITDYSSVCWDVLYMEKPVVFYQFDQDLYQDVVGAYIDFDSQMPGDVCKVEDDLIASVESCLAGGFTMSEDHRETAAQWFAHKDTHNRERTYRFLLDQGF